MTMTPKNTLKAWPAPAKINLFLHVVGKRADGYHDLQTVFQLLDYGDELTFQIRTDGAINRHYDLGFDVAHDLCVRAAQLLKAYADTTQGVDIGLVKRLPMGGGLGGGSSNAATTLLALNDLWQLGLTRQTLAELGLQLGADVPVFVMGQSAWAEGVGEQLTPLKLPEKWFLVLVPPVSVSTSAIFSNKHLTPRPEMMTIRTFQEGHGENQLEQIVRVEYPQVDALLNWLSQYGKPRMSGSGGSVFIAVESRQHGLSILQKKPLGSTGFVTKGVNQHPLLTGQA